LLQSNPNPDSALNGTCRTPPEEYEKCVLSAILGDTVRGHSFKPHLSPNLTPAMRARFAGAGLPSLLRLAGNCVSTPLAALQELPFPLPPYLQAISDLQPAVADLICLPPARRPRCTINERTRDLSKALETPVEPGQVMKEMVLCVDGRPLLVLSSGAFRLDLVSLAELLEVPAQSLTVPSRLEAEAFFKNGGLSKLSPILPAEWPNLFVQPDMRVLLDERMSLQPFVYASMGEFYLKLETAALFRLHPGLTSGFVAAAPQEEDTYHRTGMDKRFSFYFPSSLLALNS
jgi:prolyl-tRNA editing enzyme YbaK/EbsC (Cys-tRNA(Pro) deacylase)